MAWELEIITIDVGQGESALIVAYDPTSGQSRTMLIDAGLAGYASMVNNLVGPRLDRLGTSRLDQLVVSHYDDDHSGGVVSLLEADNYSLVLAELANAAGLAAATANAANKARPNVVAASAAAVAATAKGAYNGQPALSDSSGVATTAANNAQNATTIPVGNDTKIVEAGLAIGYQTLYGVNVNPSIVVVDRLVRRAALAGAPAAADTAGNAAARAAAARQRMADHTGYSIRQPSRFQTRGRYAACNVIDLGTASEPDSYAPAIGGRVLMLGYAANVPRPGRTRTSVGQAQLGSEVLWGTGAGAGGVPQGAPAVFLVAADKWMWKAPRNSCPITSGQPSNDASIGLLLRFGDFAFYTGGDLPSQGEDLVGNAVRANALGTFAAPDRVPAFKCGHHGSSHSTSTAFLGRIQPVAAMLSCGVSTFGDEHHPSQDTVTRLVDHAGLRRFFLTNCKYLTTGIPATAGKDQLNVLSNKSRVCGDNADRNQAKGRRRGDIALYASAAGVAPGKMRGFRVDYWDADKGAGARAENLLF